MELCDDLATADAPTDRPFYTRQGPPSHLAGNHLQALTQQQQQMLGE